AVPSPAPVSVAPAAELSSASGSVEAVSSAVSSSAAVSAASSVPAAASVELSTVASSWKENCACTGRQTEILMDKATITVNRRFICMFSCSVLLFCHCFPFINIAVFLFFHYTFNGAHVFFYCILTVCTNQVKIICKNVTFRVGCKVQIWHRS